MAFPTFFEKVPTITLHDPLAQLLGAAEGGTITYGYSDAVRLAGHSCPTVAGAYLMTVKALTQLYGSAMPERGAVRVALREPVGAGVVGVIASVAGLITGAAGEGGFKGLGGQFSRRDLLSFGARIKGEIRFTRVDTGAGVDVEYRAQRVPPVPAMGEVFAKLQSGQATAEDRETFGRLWQERVQRILLEHFDDPELVLISGA
jgi:hypothetical protein